MRHAADGIVGLRAAQLLFGHVFVSHGLDHVRPGDKHVAGVAHHEDEIGKGGRIYGAAGAGSHDGRDLRNHAARECVAQENISVAREREHAFLDARAAGIVQADHGRASFEREVHDLADFLRIGFRERSAKNSKILREDVRQAPVNAAISGDETVAVDHLFVHAEVARAMANQLVHLFEGAFIEQQVDPLARQKLALLMLPLDARLAAARVGIGVAAADFGKSVGGHELQDTGGGKQKAGGRKQKAGRNAN